jgi:hypothetical protein
MSFMMQRQLHPIIEAMGETFHAEFAPASQVEHQADVRTVSAFMERQILQMTDLFFLPFAILTLFFSWTALGTGGRRFEHLPLDARQRHVRAWKQSGIGPCRTLMNVYESLFLVGMYGA